MRRCVSCLALAGALAIGSVSIASAGPILYSQPATFLPTAGSAYTSEIATDLGGTVFQVWDNFVLAAGGYIGAVTWQGIYVNDLGATFVDATSFDVRFYADAAGAPGAQLYNASFPVGDTHQTFVGTQSWFGNDSPVFNYEVSLPAAFTAAAGTQYWLSIVAHSPTFRPVWAWTAGTGGNDSSVQDLVLDAAPPYLVGQDRAFTLVPEPASLALLSMGLFALRARAKNRKH